jgi:hypothetical protein
MAPHPKQAWIEHSNADTLYHLERQGRTGPGLVPFLGAGISTTFGLKDWRGLLLGAAPPGLVATVERRLHEGDYEGGAQLLLERLGPDGFQNMVAAAAGDANLERFDFRSGTVSLLPLLARGPVVTTNFDRVLERAFLANGSPFESVVSGPRPDLIVDALHGDRHVLIKLHGDWQDRVGRTFAASDYDANYGDAQPEKKRELLEGVERLLFSSRSLLFIGASLGPDRTVRLLQKVHGDYAGIRHYAIMTAPASPEAFEQKELDLRSCGVLPLWYVAETREDHGPAVERLVADIVERISVRTVKGPGLERLPAWPGSAAMPPSDTPDEPIDVRDGHFDRVVRLIEDGRLTFFLGSAVHKPTRLMAEEFYGELARLFECEALTEERFAVAQYIADRHGRENLYGEIRRLFARAKLVPRLTHELFAAWPTFTSHLGAPLPYPMIFTTNYDDVLECRLEEANLPYHLFTYQADGPEHGRFYHRDVAGAVRIIERPRNIRRLADGFVVVKLNGGFDRRHRIPESYATTRLDYWDLAARMPDVLPAVVQGRLLSNPLLFLGHGLVAADVEALVRFAHRDHPGPRSWAVVLRDHGVEYWRQLGVEILDAKVELYVKRLRDRLAGNGSGQLFHDRYA